MAGPKTNQEKKSRNVWKFVSIIFIVLFALILVSSVIRNYVFRPQFTRHTDSQIETAKNIALNDFQKRGEDITNYNISVSPRIRPINMDRAPKNVIEVSMYNDTLRHSYIVDIDSETIQMYMRTESYGLINYSDDMHRPQDAPGIFSRFRI